MADFLSGAQKLGGSSPTTPSSAPVGGGSGGGVGSMPLSSLTLKGMHFTNPAAPTTARITSDQQISQALEDAQDKLNILKKTVDADKVRRKLSGGMLDQMMESFSNKGQMYLYKHGPAGTGGIKVPRSSIGFATAQFRTRANAIQRLVTGLKSYQAIQDVQEHMPMGEDTDELLDDKIQMWQDALDEGFRQLRERGIPVYGQSNVPVSKGATPKVSLPKPPFHVKYMDATSSPPRATDDAGNGWYLDPESHEWVEIGK